MPTLGKIQYEEARQSLINQEKGRKAVVLGTGLSLEAYNPAKYSDYVKIAIDNALKVHDADYCISRDFKKLNAISFNVQRRPDTKYIFDLDAMSYVFKAPSSTFLFGESIHDRFSKAKSLNWDDFGKCSIAFALEICKIMGIKEIDLYGADFYEYKKKKYAFDLGKEYLSDTPSDSRALGDDKFTNSNYDNQISEIEEILKSDFGISIHNKNKESRLKCNAKNA